MTPCPEKAFGDPCVLKQGHSEAHRTKVGLEFETLIAMPPNDALAEHDARIRAEERERCAKLLDDIGGWRNWEEAEGFDKSVSPTSAAYAADWLAEKIRALK